MQLEPDPTHHGHSAGEIILTLAGSAIALMALIALANQAPELLLGLLH